MRHNAPVIANSALVAQLDRASVSGTEGQGFESLRARQLSRVHAGHIKRKIVLTGALGLLWALTTSQALAQLRVDLSTENRAWGSATLDEAPPGLYGTRSGIEAEEIRAVRCSDSGNLSTSKGKVSVGAGCGTLTWQFSLAPYPVQGEVASRQLSWFSEVASWWLVSEGNAILQASDAGAASDIRFLLDGQPLETRAGPRRVPKLHQAPGFWLLGDPIHLDKGNVRHFFDRSAVPRHLVELLDSHAKGMEYLLEVLPNDDLPPVFWMGLADWQSTMGGAAGTGLVLANYPFAAHEFDNTAYAITLYVVLHEHSHELFGETGSLWINESLASYLALKAIKETAPEHYPVIADAFIEPGNKLETSLPVIGERAAAGDGQAYSQLYMGAAFWAAIDAAMVRQGTHGGLLEVLPKMIARALAPGGTLRREEIAEVTGLTSEALSPILDQFLGTTQAVR